MKGDEYIVLGDECECDGLVVTEADVAVLWGMGMMVADFRQAGMEGWRPQYCGKDL